MRWLLLFVPLALAGCARHYTPQAFAEPYGFWWGVWHGFIFPYALSTNLVSWLLSLVGVDWFDAIEIVGRPNIGTLYYVGFVLGLVPYGGGARN